MSRTSVPSLSAWLAVGALALAAAGCVNDVADNASVTILSNARWLAFQESANLPWSVREPDNSSGGLKTYTFKVEDPQSRFGLAVVCDAGSAQESHTVSVFYGTSAELTRVRRGCETDPAAAPHRGVVGNLLNVEPARAAVVNLTDDRADIYVTAYADEVAIGEHDILAYEGVFNGSHVIPDTFFLSRGVTIKESSDRAFPQRYDVDFGGPQAVPADATPRQVQVGGVATAGSEIGWEATVFYVSRHQNRLPLMDVANPGSDFQYRGVPLRDPTVQQDPPLVQKPDEGHVIAAQAFDGLNRVSRYGARFLKQPADAALALPEPRDLGGSVTQTNGRSPAQSVATMSRQPQTPMIMDVVRSVQKVKDRMGSPRFSTRTSGV